MTDTLVMADMSTIAPLIESDGVTVLGFYIGGDTPNVPLISAVKALGTEYLLPIYTRSNPQQIAVETDAQAAIKHLGLIGAPKDTAVALDFEISVDATWVDDFNAILKAAGYLVMLYGTKSDVEQNPATSAGRWDADWTDEAHLNQGSTATQYASDEQAGRSYDLSLIAADAPLWSTRESVVTVPADPTVKVLQTELNETGARLKVDGVKGPLTEAAFTRCLNAYGIIVYGNGGPAVRVLQAMLNTWWSILSLKLAVDGEFGSETADNVQEFQQKRNVVNSVVHGTGDGQVGPDTKAALAA